MATKQITVSDVAAAIVAGLEDGSLSISVNRTFASGSRGHYVSGKLVIGGERCQFGAPITVIGSKPSN